MWRRSETNIPVLSFANEDVAFEEKSQALESGAIIDVVEERLRMDAYSGREARLEVMDYHDETVVVISDEGPGFKWKEYLDRNLVEITGVNGRGILMSQQIFKTMTYIGNGNKVVVVVDKSLPNTAAPASSA